MESSGESLFAIKLKYLERAKEMITHPELPIVRIRVAGEGDEEGEMSKDLGLMNGHIEDVLRIAAQMDMKGSLYNWLGEDCEVSLVLYSMDDAIRYIASLLPGKDIEASSPEKHKTPNIITHVPSQKEIHKKVAFTIENKRKDDYIGALNPKTNFITTPLSWAPNRETIMAVEV